MQNQLHSALPTVATEYVLPAPPRGSGEIVVVAPDRDSLPALRRSGEVARVLGERFAVLTESQQLFLAELCERLEALDAAIVEAPRAQLKGAVREIAAVLDWCDATQRDLVQQSRCAAAGHEPIDLATLADEVVVSRLSERPVHVIGHGAQRWWGESAAVGDLIRSGVELLIERAPGAAAVVVEVIAGDRAPRLRFASAGEPSSAIDAAVLRRFRAAVDAVGAQVLPDELGPNVAACLVELPA